MTQDMTPGKKGRWHGLFQEMCVRYGKARDQGRDISLEGIKQARGSRP